LNYFQSGALGISEANP